MLKRLIRLTSVTTWNALSGVNFQKSTIVYADNGRGKTSLAAVVRSLALNDPTHIIERSTIGTKSPPHVQLLFDDGGKNTNHEFKNGAWNFPQPKMEVFDTRFVSDNVYSGDLIEPEHRRQLYHFVLGAANVSLAQKVDDLDREAREINGQCTLLETEIGKTAAPLYTVDAFVKLSVLAHPVAEIANQEALVRATEQAQQISATPLFTELPLLDARFSTLRDCLRRSLDDIAVSAAEHVQRHQASRLGAGGREWIEQGVSFLGERTECPFCGLETSGSTLIADYRMAFSDAYKKEVGQIDDIAAHFRGALSLKQEMTVKALISANESIAPFWNGHGVAAPIGLSRSVGETMSGLRSVVEQLLAVRRNDLSRSVEINTDHEVIFSETHDFQEEIANYNQHVRTANAHITALKRAAAIGNLSEERAALSRMRQQVARHSAEISALCDQLHQARAKKRLLEADKDAAKKTLDAYTTALFAKYQDRINHHLLNSGCNYSIVGTKTSFAGGKPRTEYQLQINGRPVELVQSKGTPTAPTFRNTLSDGDRSTLALAFFLARLDLDPDLGTKVILIDDPMTSLDAHRRAYTCEQVARLSTLAGQVIVLTHDSMFAADIWNRSAAPKVALTLAANGKQTVIEEWDIENATASDYFQRCRLLYRCVNGETGLDLIAVAGSIRLVLEGNLRMRFPSDLPHGKWLGDLIRAIQDAPVTSALSAAQKHVPELIDLNAYSKNYHHDAAPGVTMPVLSLSELQAYCRRTLEFIRGT